jgi:hypothetical protein
MNTKFVRNGPSVKVITDKASPGIELQNVQVSDTTDPDSSNEAGYINLAEQLQLDYGKPISSISFIRDC